MATHAHSLFGTGNHGGRSALVGLGAGLGLALLGTAGRKLMVQGTSALAGSWDEALKHEHKSALALFDRLAQTKDSEKIKRTILLSKLKHALGKHAFEEENVVYPAMRDAGMEAEADELNKDHGYVKQYLYDLAQLTDDHMAFQTKVAEFRADIRKHMAEEEEDLFPRLRSRLTDKANRSLGMKMNREGLKLA